MTTNSQLRRRHVKPANILVVDDEAVIRDMMVDILSLEGYEPLLARNGKDALEQLENEQSCLIFLDIMMPVMDGRDFCQHLQLNEELRQKHIIVVMSALDNLVQSEQLDVDATMSKPFTVDDVMRVLQSYIE